MADNARPPFRADHVGSLLRPKEVLQAREEFAGGEIRAEQLTQVEDAAIRDIIRKQGEVGLKSATDGELRRQSWHMDFIYQLGGVTQVNDDTIRVAFHNKDKNYEYAPPSAHITAPISLPRHDLRRRVHVRPGQRGGGPDAEADHPVAVDGALPGRPGRHRQGRVPRPGAVLG